MFARFWVAGAACVVLMLAVQPVAAQGAEPSSEPPASAAIFKLNADASHDALAATLIEAAHDTINASPSYSSVTRVSMEVSEVALLVSCSSESRACLRMIANEVGARVLIYGTLRQLERDLQLQLHVFDAGRGEVRSQFSKTLPAASAEQFVDDVVAFFDADYTAGTRLQVGSSVVGAEVLIDGELVGTAPIERKALAPGAHHVRVRHPSYAEWETTIEVRPGGSYELWAQLSPAQTGVVIAPVDEAVRAERINWVAWSIAGAGAASAVGAVVSGVLLESTERELRGASSDARLTLDDFEQLNRRGRAAEKVHLVTVGVAVAGLAVGGSMLLIDLLRSKRQARERAVVGIGPAGVAAKIVW